MFSNVNVVVLLNVCPAVNAWADQTSDFPWGLKASSTIPFSQLMGKYQSDERKSTKYLNSKGFNTGLC